MKPGWTADRQEANALFTRYIGQPQNWNRYAYALNNPLRFVDPDGLKSYPVTVLGQTVMVHLDSTTSWHDTTHQRKGPNGWAVYTESYYDDLKTALQGK